MGKIELIGHIGNHRRGTTSPADQLDGPITHLVIDNQLLESRDHFVGSALQHPSGQLLRSQARLLAQHRKSSFQTGPLPL